MRRGGTDPNGGTRVHAPATIDHGVAGGRFRVAWAPVSRLPCEHEEARTYWEHLEEQVRAKFLAHEVGRRTVSPGPPCAHSLAGRRIVGPLRNCARGTCPPSSRLRAAIAPSMARAPPLRQVAHPQENPWFLSHHRRRTRVLTAARAHRRSGSRSLPSSKPPLSASHSHLPTRRTRKLSGPAFRVRSGRLRHSKRWPECRIYNKRIADRLSAPRDERLASARRR